MNAVTIPKSFEDKMKDRIKDSIGDLIDDEALKKLVEKGIQAAFFETRTVPNGSYSTTTKPSLIQEMIHDLMVERMTAEVKAYLQTRASEIEVIIKDVVQQGMGKALLSAIDMKFQGDIFNLQQNMLNNLQRG